MSPARSSLIRRRRSSVAMGLTQVKPGNYGINTSSSPRALTFAPNVTPGTYVEADDDLDGEDQTTLPATALFPPTEPTAAPTRRRLPPGKRLSQGYIPRPPNAFMLFRANFVRQKHVPGSIETNHGSLSKIIGNCWRALPLEEKRHWEHEAKKAKAAHREKWPNYRFRPVHNKNKKKGGDAAVPVPIGRKDKLQPPPADEERCEVVAQLLLEGKKGEELAEAIRQIDMARAMSRPESAESHHVNNQFAQSSVPLYLQRRPSSVPPPTTLYNPAHNIAIPSLPFFAAPTPQAAFGSNAMFNGAEYPMGVNSAHGSRAASPVGNIARAQRNFLGMRRASSCQPIPSERMWDGYDPHPHHLPYGQPAPVPPAWQMQLQPDWEPLPEVTDASIFQPGWTNSFKDAPPEPSQFDPHMQAYLPPDAPPPHATLHVNIGPLDNYDFASTPSTATDSYSAVTPGAGGMFEPIDPHATWPVPESGPSSAFSGSPAHSDSSLPTLVNGQVPHQVDHQGPLMCAPQPQHPQLQFNDSWAAEHELDKMHAAQQPVSMHDDQHISTLLDDTYAMYGDVGMDGMDMGMEMAPVGVDYGYGAVSQEF